MNPEPNLRKTRDFLSDYLSDVSSAGICYHVNLLA